MAGMEAWRGDILLGLEVRLASSSSDSGDGSATGLPTPGAVAPDADAGKEGGTRPTSADDVTDDVATEGGVRPTSSDAGSAAPRFLTPRECARLQGFPDSFKLPPDSTQTDMGGGGRASHGDDGSGGGKGRPAQTYRLLGNAVCPPVISAIGAHVMVALEVPTNVGCTAARNNPTPAVQQPLPGSHPEVNVP